VTDGSSEFDQALEAQREHVERVFREGWVPTDVGKPRTLTTRDYEAAVKANKGGWTGLDWALLRAVRDGAQPGDPLPPLEAKPFIRGVHDVEVRVVGIGPERRVAAFFSHAAYPGVRFGHRFAPDGAVTNDELIDLMEAIETGRLYRLMQDRPQPDESGVVWTAFWER